MDGDPLVVQPQVSLAELSSCFYTELPIPCPSAEIPLEPVWKG